MRYLLDTHAFLWSIVHPVKLSPAARTAIQDSRNAILVSTVSFWEIALKFSLKKLDLEGVRPEQLPELARQTGFTISPLDADDAATFHQFASVGSHKDPFDRMLAWQAIRSRLTLISRDRIMAAYQPHGLTLLW